MYDASTEVQTGAELLDEHRPDWWKEINLGQLRVADGGSCVLGQLFGSYYVGKGVLGIDHGGPYGFDLAENNFLGTYGELDQLWIDLINTRRLEASVS